MTDKQKVSKKLREIEKDYKLGLANIRQAKKLCMNGKYVFEVTILACWRKPEYDDKDVVHKGLECESVEKVKKDAIVKWRKANNRNDSQYYTPEIRVVFENGVSFEIE